MSDLAPGKRLKYNIVQVFHKIIMAPSHCDRLQSNPLYR